MLLILASASPRRHQLIQQLGLPVHIQVADVDEDSITISDPARNAIDTALLKAQAIYTTNSSAGSRPSPIHGALERSTGTSSPCAETAPQTTFPPSIIIGSDTNVTFANSILGKPRDTAHAWEMLRLLRGKTHQVHTGIALIDTQTGRAETGVSTSHVTMRPYTDDEIAAYIATGDPMDKAGAYAIQHPHFRPVAHLNGCYNGVMGLSLCVLADLLSTMGVPLPNDMAHRCRQSHNSAK